MDLIQLFQDFGVNYATEGYKYCRPGWVNVDCPYCVANSPGPHLGFELNSVHCNCWSCGWHPTIPTLSKLLSQSIPETTKILKNYGNSINRQVKQPLLHIRVKSFRFPTNTGILQKNHRKYLESRNFDPDYLEQLWGLKGTGPISVLDTIDYKHRIIIPFNWQMKVVSFDSRDVTGKHLAKYMACPKEREFTPHKSILYGKQKLWGETGIILEGPTDVWRFGPKSVAVSGIEFKPEQIRVIAKQWKRVAVCFDGDEVQARIQANKLVSELKFRNVDAFRVDIHGDPGGMAQKEADYLVKQLVKKIY